MKLLELFAGSRSIGKIAESKGGEVYSSDIEPFEKIDYVVDILKFDTTKVPWVPDIIWGSSPCTAFSVASIGKHWTGEKGAYIPKSDEARLGIALAKKTIEIIEHFKLLNPHLVWYMENPRGVLRQMPFMKALPIRHTICYCQYYDSRMKPTDIFTNNHLWIPRPMCKNNGYGMSVFNEQTWALDKIGRPCHIAAPRGAKTGTQGLKGAYVRSMLPEAFCEEIMQASQKFYNYANAIPIVL